MERLALPHVERRIGAYRPTRIPDLLAKRRAAVATILRFEREAPDVLLIKRARREGDRWSGHVAFPGGRQEEQDDDLHHTAVRETHEEVGLDLSAHGRLLGRLDDVMAIAKGKVLPMAITPFVYLQTEPSELVLNHEAEDSFWLPLDEVWSGKLSGKLPYEMGPLTLQLSCWSYEGFTVWGLTHTMLSRFLQILR